MPQTKKPVRRDKQIRARCTDQEHAHLQVAAEDAGFKEVSAYIRNVLLSRHVMVVGPLEFVLIPALTASHEERYEARLLLDVVLKELNGLAAEDEPPAQTSPDGDLASEWPPEETLPPQGAEAESSAAASDQKEKGPSPDLHDAGEGMEPPSGPGLPATPPVETATAEAGPSAPAAGGDDFELPPADPEPLGAVIAAGEDEGAFLARRTEELRRQGRPGIVARYEAEAEYRQLVVGTPAPTPSQPPGAPVSCPACGTLKRRPGPCPDCGAA